MRLCAVVLLLHLLQLLMLPSLLVLQLLMLQPLMLLAVSTDTVPQLLMLQPLMLLPVSTETVANALDFMRVPLVDATIAHALLHTTENAKRALRRLDAEEQQILHRVAPSPVKIAACTAAPNDTATQG